MRAWPPQVGGAGAAGGAPPEWMLWWVLQQQAQVDSQQRLLMALADQQVAILQHLSRTPNPKPLGPGGERGPPTRMNKMGPEDDPEAYLNIFERVATTAGWPAAQWAAILTPCLTGLAQEAVDTLTATQAAGYPTVRDAVLGTLNVSEETYRRCLREVEFPRGSSVRLAGNRIRAIGLRWLKPATRTAQEVTEMILIEQFVSILPQAARNWVLCQKPPTLEAAVTAMETYETATQPGYSSHNNTLHGVKRQEVRILGPRPGGGSSPRRSAPRREEPPRQRNHHLVSCPHPQIRGCVRWEWGLDPTLPPDPTTTPARQPLSASPVASWVTYAAIAP